MAGMTNYDTVSRGGSDYFGIKEKARMSIFVHPGHVIVEEGVSFQRHGLRLEELRAKGKLLIA
jgi:hypothetical protein